MAPQSLSCFHEALNWQVWQVGFLFVFSVQFDGEKADKITRGACDSKRLFQDIASSRGRALFYSSRRAAMGSTRIARLAGM
jgi:hypothetical protein